MAESPHTIKRFSQWRGPQHSDQYNGRVNENYKDLTYLYNALANLDADQLNGFIAFFKDITGMTRAYSDIEARLSALETASNIIPFSTSNQIDNDRFSATAFSINDVDRATFDSAYGLLTLPHVPASSMSKIRYVNDDGTANTSSSLELIVSPITSSADNTTAIIDTSQPYNAVVGRPGRVWERNVITSTPDYTDGAQCYLYIRIPNDLSATTDTNCLSFIPFPMMTVDILEVAYSTETNVRLTSAETWTPLNDSSIYFNVDGAPGHLPPGAWDGDEILNSSSKKFHFDPMPITAFRLHLRQPNYYTESAKYIYTYGMSKLDIRYEKFLDTGKTIIRFDAPTDTTISTIRSITPQMWNVPEYLVNDAFSYRVIWETSYNSGSYTLTPVPLSRRVWIEVTLNKMEDGGTPALSGLLLNSV